MIHPTQLTKEAGFEEGVVVEIVWEDDDHKPWLTHWPIFALSGINPIRSIRPLTGPMAIWNFAPDDAEILHRKIDGGFDWLLGTVEGWKMNYGDGDFSHRPWWAK